MRGKCKRNIFQFCLQSVNNNIGIYPPNYNKGYIHPDFCLLIFVYLISHLYIVKLQAGNDTSPMSKSNASRGLSPFVLHIFWNGEDDRAKGSIYAKYIKRIYEFFNRAENDPLDIILGIPVYLHPEPVENAEALILESSAYSCSLFIIDEKVVETADWFNNLQQAHDLSQSSVEHQFLPLKLTKKRVRFLADEFYLNPELLELSTTDLLIRLSHSVFQHLIKQEQAEHGRKGSNDLMRIFISHAKRDGVGFAAGLKAHIDKIPQLRSFYDAKDLAWGVGIRNQLDQHIANALLLVIHTDVYSSREWCRKEVNLAKKHQRPILVVNLFKEGERRSFPYLGNVPHLRFSEEILREENKIDFYNALLLSILGEGLRLTLSSLAIYMLTKDLSVQAEAILSYPPELLTVSQIKADGNPLVIYPDPPLGQTEQNILKEAYPHFTFMTPTFLSLLAQDDKMMYKLNGLRVGFSLSGLEKHSYDWIDYHLIQDIAAVLFRYLLVGGAVIHYGGSLAYDQTAGKNYNFVYLLKSLLQTYRDEFEVNDSLEIKSIENYTFVPFPEPAKTRERRAMENVINFHEIGVNEKLKLKELQLSELNDVDQKGFYLDVFQKRVVWSISLMEMRQKMLEKEDARIVMGGKWKGFVGRMSGVLEESWMCLQQEKPLYILGGFGGVSASIAACLQGEKIPELSVAYYQQHDGKYSEFLEEFNKLSIKNNFKAEFSYTDIFELLQDKAKQPGFGLNNGLSREENLRLFTSKSAQEIVYLILKGMRQLKTETSK